MTRTKEPAGRNRHLLDMAQGMPCLLHSPVCNGDSDTVVAAHSNQSRHGKAMGRKANDQFHVHACARCHAWLDQSYTATKVTKEATFNAGHKRQVALWQTISTDPKEDPRDRKAALWALEQLA